MIQRPEVDVCLKDPGFEVDAVVRADLAAFTKLSLGYIGLNETIDHYRLRVPWAPIGLSFCTAIFGVLLMAGPLSAVFFVLVAIWARRTSETAAMICDAEARAIIGAPLPKEPPPKTGPEYDL